MQPAWDLISRWEQQEPVQHRIPIPEPLVRAMIVLAWLHGWYSWCCATAVAFYGGGRLGEILKCCRSDLLLPVDFLDSGTAPVFLKLSHFKSKNRQLAKVQHLRVTEENLFPLASRILQSSSGKIAFWRISLSISEALECHIEHFANSTRCSADAWWTAWRICSLVLSYQLLYSKHYVVPSATLSGDIRIIPSRGCCFELLCWFVSGSPRRNQYFVCFLSLPPRSISLTWDL